MIPPSPDGLEGTRGRRREGQTGCFRSAYGYSSPLTFNFRLPTVNFSPSKLLRPLPRRMQDCQHPYLIFLHAIGNEERRSANDQFPRALNSSLPACHRVPRKELCTFPNLPGNPGRRRSIFRREVVVRIG